MTSGEALKFSNVVPPHLEKAQIEHLPYVGLKMLADTRNIGMRALIAQDFRNAFDRGVDLLFTPTTPSPAFKAGEKLDDPIAMYLNDVFTIPADMSGVPAVSVPCGFTPGGLPIGLQLIGRPFGEPAVLSTARAWESVAGLSTRRPPITLRV